MNKIVVADLDISKQVNIKATITEDLDFTGHGKRVATMAVDW